MIKTTRGFICAAVVVFVCGCAAMPFRYESPTVTLSSFRILPSEEMGPRFEIGLHVVNPNRASLKLQGIAYTVIIEGHRILTGVANDLPVIEGYGQGDVVLIATADLFNSISLISGMLKEPRDTVSYELVAKLDLGGFHPYIYVEKKGDISLPRTGR